jgi:hypothetical protein
LSISDAACPGTISNSSDGALDITPSQIEQVKKQQPGHVGRISILGIVSCVPFLNPEGIPAQSPGLRETRYPGGSRHTILFNRNAVVAKPRDGCRNPFGVENRLRLHPG